MNEQLLFERIVQFTLDIEGGESDHEDDPGGYTKYGISQQFHPDVDVENLTWPEAIEIYRDAYWKQPRINELHPMWGMVVFDTGVHNGTELAIQWLQEVCRVKVDGIIGPKTIAAAVRRRGEYFLGLYLDKRLQRMVTRDHGGAFLTGWRIRVMRLFAEARTLM